VIQSLLVDLFEGRKKHSFRVDTPGISKPNIKNMHVGMKLAVCNTLRDEVIGTEVIRYRILQTSRHQLNC
jgi:ribosome biogenesis GTPase A